MQYCWKGYVGNGENKLHDRHIYFFMHGKPCQALLIPYPKYNHIIHSDSEKPKM